MSGTIVRYAGSDLYQNAWKYAKPFVGPRVRAAAKVGGFVYRNRGKIGGYAKYVTRRKKKRKIKNERSQPYPSFKRENMDTSIFPSPDTTLDLNAKVLRIDKILFPRQGLGPNKRLGNQIYFKGMHLCLNAFNDCPYPVEMHWALIQITSENPQAGTIGTEFFRADDDGTGSINFVNAQAGEPTSLPWDIRYICNPLNTANKRVILHRKWTVGPKVYTAGGAPAVGAQHSMTKDNHIKLDTYIPIKRYVHLDNDQDVSNEKPFFKVMWWQSVDPQDHLTAGTEAKLRWQTIQKMFFGNVTL